MLRIPAIMSPVDRVDEVEELIITGATELYCGVVTKEWVDRYSIAASNRRVEIAANFKSFEDLARCVDIARPLDVPVFLTLNEHYYTWEQYPMLLDHIARAVDSGISALIVSDPALMLVLKDRNIDIPVHVSTGGAVLNSLAADFYRDLGASRVTLDRQLTIAEMADIMRGIRDMEMAIFILNSRCANIDGLCTFDHTPFKCPEPEKFLGKERMEGFDSHAFSKDIVATGACMLPYRVEFSGGVPALEGLSREEAEKARDSILDKQLYWDRHHIDDVPCGACALYDLSRMGITAVKIVGRGNPTSRKVGDVGFIRMLLKLLEDGSISRGEYMAHASALYGYNYRRRCKQAYCYYPGVSALKKVEVP